ncbi:MAG: gliding motility-associated ABC transporter ATP-binding subunit GldA [Bacteroidota bacterium]
MSIEVSHLTKIYGEQKALEDVSLQVKSGEVVGLLGPNGAGKSTLMKIITCFIPPSSGNVTVNGFDINDDPLEIKKQVGYLPENNPLYTDMYVREYLNFVAGLNHISTSREMVDQIIETTGLTPEQNKKIGQLSKGYRQRVGLAQALLPSPDVLILDEPTSGLDPNQLVDIRELIKSIGKEKTILFSTHIMQEVEAVCDRVIIIDKGRIVADEKTGDIAHQSSERNIVTVEFDKEVNPQTLQKVPGVSHARSVSGNQWVLVSEEKGDIRSALFRFAVDNGLTILSLNKEKESLEQVFQRLTSGLEPSKGQ